MLDGVRIIELGTVITAPLAGMMLADLGADVIKIERVEGDPFRHTLGDSYGPNFVAFNRNKRSVVLDLATDAGRADLHALIATADVLLDNFRPGVLDRLELDAASVRARWPRLIHCSITGFGDTGPYRSRPAFDAVAQALSGITMMSVDPECPQSFGPTISDNVSGMYASYAIVAALYERRNTGVGRRIEVNMLEASMSFIADAFSNFMRAGVEGTRFSRTANSQSFVMRCADDRLIAIHLSTQEKFWTGLLGAMEAPDLAIDTRFRTRQERVMNYQLLQTELNSRFAAKTRDQWQATLTTADVPFAPVDTLREALADPQVVALGTVYETHHPQHGRVMGLHGPVLVDGERIDRRRQPAPALGEHTDQVLREIRI